MKRTSILGLVVAGVVMLTANWAMAGSVGLIDTERFGYSGTITRYSDSGLTTQVGSVVVTGPRDVAIWTDSEYPASVVMGSWWYSTATDTNGNPLGLGWGNTNGNTGPGFMQYYDMTQAYVTDQSYAFTDFDGSNWTTFAFSLDVAMTQAGASSRLSAPANTGDAGFYQALRVDLEATGLKGVESNGWIVAKESDAFASSVTGKISGVFVNTSTSVPANNGYYVFDFDLSLDNWAFANRNALVGTDYGTFYEGSFGAAVPVPLPAAVWAGLSLLGALGVTSKLRSTLRRRNA